MIIRTCETGERTPKKTSRIFQIVLAIAAVVALVIVAVVMLTPRNKITILHHFTGGNFTGGSNDGWFPVGSLPLSGSTLYGMTEGGGSGNNGVIFKINTDGSGYTILHSFVDGIGFLGEMRGSLTLSGSTLYGTKQLGGRKGKGMVFKINTDGSGYSVLHSFAGGSEDGSEPYDTLTLSGSTLYGMASSGGNNNFGVVFKINTDGSGYNILHTFAGGSKDGREPYGSLTLSGSTLYGFTGEGGSKDLGVVFKINIDGSGYSILHYFNDRHSSGSYLKLPGSLVLSGTILYSVSQRGGSSGSGILFKMNSNGSGYTNLHSFGQEGLEAHGWWWNIFCLIVGGSGDGRIPHGWLTLSGSTLYGTRMPGRMGESMNGGVVFKINTDGSGYTKLHSFGGSDGAEPHGPLTFSGSTLYGVTRLSRDSGAGVVFKLDLNP